MAGTSANARIWVNADVYTAPTGTAEPTNIAGSLNAAWKALGLLSEDGMTESREEEVTDHYAHGGILVRTTRSKHKRSFKVTALEDNDTVFRLVNPGSVPFTAASITTRNVYVPDPNRRMFLIETVDGAYTRRRVIPDGEVSEVGEVAMNDDELQMFELTISCYPAASGLIYKDITDDPQADFGMSARRVVLAEFADRKRAEGGIEIELPDASVIVVDPPQLWADDVVALFRGNDEVEGVKQLLGKDDYERLTGAGGSAIMVMAMVQEATGVDLGESSASSAT